MTDRRSVAERLETVTMDKESFIRGIKNFTLFTSRNELKNLIGLKLVELRKEIEQGESEELIKLKGLVKSIDSSNKAELEMFISFYSRYIRTLIPRMLTVSTDNVSFIKDATKWLVEYDKIIEAGLQGKALLSMVSQLFYVNVDTYRRKLIPDCIEDLDKNMIDLLIENFDLLEPCIYERFDYPKLSDDERGHSIGERIELFNAIYNKHGKSARFDIFDPIIRDCYDWTEAEKAELNKIITPTTEIDCYDIGFDIGCIAGLALSINKLSEFIDHCYEVVIRDKGTDLSECKNTRLLIMKGINRHFITPRNRLNNILTRLNNQKEELEKKNPLSCIGQYTLNNINEEIGQREKELEKYNKIIEKLETREREREEQQQQVERRRFLRYI